jgi:hypothetical protein
MMEFQAVDAAARNSLEGTRTRYRPEVVEVSLPEN